MMERKNFAWPATAISKEDYDLIINWAEKYNNLPIRKKILIFGAGIRGALISEILETVGISEIAFTDNNKEKWGGFIDEHPIISTADAFKNKEEYVFVISVEEGDNICEQLESNNLKRDKDYFYLKNDIYDKFMTIYKAPMEQEILVLGDCMFEVVAFNDINKTSMAEMLYAELKDDVKCLTMHGLSAPGFLHMVRGQINSNMIPRCIVVMLNFETLTGKQHLLPRSQHRYLIRSTCEITPDPDGKMLGYLKLVESRLNNITAEFFTSDKFSASNNSAGKISDAAAKIFFKMNYLYSLDIKIESIVCLQEIMKISREHSVKVVPFVPPVNYERGYELFGKEYFEERYSENLNKLRKVIEDANYELLDLSHICSKSEFADITTPDETTNYIGRKHVVVEIVKELRSKGVI